MTTYCNCNNSSSLSSVAIYYSSYESLVSKFDHYLVLRTPQTHPNTIS